MNINHTACTHPATKAARAKCRRDAAKAPKVTPTGPTLDEVVASYYDGSADAEEFAASLLGLQGQHPELRPLIEGYYDGSLELEEIAAGALRLAPHTAPDDRPVPPMVKVSDRYNIENYRMRGSSTYKGDWVKGHSRKINGKAFDFTKIRWADGSVTVRALEGGTTNVLHEFES
jgi:hypothetical protein